MVKIANTGFKWSVLVFMSCLSLLLAGCQAERKTDAETSIVFNLQDETQDNANTVNSTTQTPVYRVELIRDEEALGQMAEDLILSQYAEEFISRQGEYEWLVMDGDSLVASFGCTSRWGLGYLDCVHDCNGTHEEAEYMVMYGYITDVIPNGLDFTATEAGELLCDFLTQYTDAFSFQTYRVLAENSADATAAGYYSAFAQALYEGVPLVLDSNADENHVFAYANIGSSGIFDLNGMFLLKETSRQEVEIVDQNEARSHLLENYAAITGASEVEIDSVELQYFVDTMDDGSYCMYPVWAFSGTLQFNEDGYVHTTRASILYYAETGLLCDVYYPGL